MIYLENTNVEKHKFEKYKCGKTLIEKYLFEKYKC